MGIGPNVNNNALSTINDRLRAAAVRNQEPSA
jgi:hypothetical protein